MSKKDEIFEILHHLEIRKKLNPLEFVQLLPQQKKIIDDPCVTKIAGGGNRSSKSFLGACYVIKKCLAKPKQRWWVCGETFADSVNIQQRKIYDLLPKLETRYCYYDEVNGFRNRKLIFKDSSQIHFRSYDQKREAFQGDDLDGILFDEEPPHDIYRECRMRLIDRNGEMLFTMTAVKGMTDLLCEIFDDHDVIESRYAPLIDEIVPTIAQKGSIKFFSLWTPDNPHIDQARVAEEAKLMTRPEIKARIYGIPTNMSGRIYPTFNHKIHVVRRDFVPKIGVSIWHVLDPHDRKPWAMTWWAIDKIGRAFCVREYPWHRNFNEIDHDDKTYADYVKLIKEIELELIEEFGRSVSKRIIDPNYGNATERKAEREGGQSKTTPKQELKKLGLHYIDGIDALEAGHLQVRKWLHYEEKNGEMIVKPRCFIADDCENTIRHLSKYSRGDIETADGDVKDNVKPLEKYKDFADNARYLFMANPHYIQRFNDLPEESKKLY